VPTLSPLLSCLINSILHWTPFQHLWIENTSISHVRLHSSSPNQQSWAKTLGNIEQRFFSSWSILNELCSSTLELKHRCSWREAHKSSFQHCVCTFAVQLKPNHSSQHHYISRLFHFIHFQSKHATSTFIFCFCSFVPRQCRVDISSPIPKMHEGVVPQSHTNYSSLVL
jgi:hypothetical protein